MGFRCCQPWNLPVYMVHLHRFSLYEWHHMLFLPKLCHSLNRSSYHSTWSFKSIKINFLEYVLNVAVHLICFCLGERKIKMEEDYIFIIWFKIYGQMLAKHIWKLENLLLFVCFKVISIVQNYNIHSIHVRIQTFKLRFCHKS